MALVHKHLIIRAEVKKAPRNEVWIEKWLKDLVENLGMKVCAGPISKYVNMVGNRGLTAVVIIETSHIAIHCWDEPNPNLIQFDVYSCGEFDPQMVLQQLEEFDLIKVEYKFIDREHGLQELI